MDVQASFPAHREQTELMQEGEGLFYDVPQLAQTLDPGGLGSRDDRFGAAFLARAAERGAAVGLVSQQCGEPAPRSAGPAGDGWVAVEQVEGAADVGDVGARGEYVDRGAVPVADQVVFAAGLAPVDRRRTCSGTPFFASM